MVYGILSKQIKNSKDLGSMISDSLGSMGSFILIVFFAAQLLAFLQWSNLGIIVSVYGAKLLQHQNGIVLIIGIIILSGLINLIIGSASAKWGILAPIFVPMMILLGYHPAFTQMIYRVGDSITNPITPMMPYMPLVLSYAQSMIKYETRFPTFKFNAIHLCVRCRMDIIRYRLVLTRYSIRTRWTC